MNSSRSPMSPPTMRSSFRSLRLRRRTGLRHSVTVTVEGPHKPWCTGEGAAMRIRGGDDTLHLDEAAGNHAQHSNQQYHPVPGTVERSPPYSSHQLESQSRIWCMIMIRVGTRQRCSGPRQWQSNSAFTGSHTLTYKCHHQGHHGEGLQEQ